MKQIKLGMSTSGIDEAIGQLQAYKSEFNSKVDKLRKRVAEELRLMVESGFSGSIVDDLGAYGVVNAQVSVKVRDEGEVSVVVATGDDAVFAEFGTGIYYNGGVGTSLHPKGAELGLTIGSYSPDSKGAYPYWFFGHGPDARMTHGAPTQMPMYNAAQDIARYIQDIAREVFAT